MQQKFNSLFAKLTLVLTVLFFLLGALVVALTLFSTEMYQQEVNQKLNHKVAAHIVNETNLINEGNINRKALKNIFDSLMVFNPSLEIYLLDHEGWIISYSAPPWKVVRQSVDLKPIKRLLNNPSDFLIKGDDPRSFDKSKAFSVAPIKTSGQFEGYLYVILGGEEYDDIVELVQSSQILQLSLLIIFIGLLFSTITGIAFFAGLTRRLKKLSDAMDHFKKYGELDKSIIPSHRKSGDEIDRLAATFSTMAEKIHSQLDYLQTTDNLRRELVANISHDLRTPLATLQGYIETLLIKENQFDPDERRYYLQIAIKHCHRLNKLVMELFELAKLDARETRPENEQFNLAELVQDIVQKFKLAAKKNKLRILVDSDPELSFVYADISLIERALENLMENAIRHTPSGGMIRISLSPENNNIAVRVSDNGCGIPETEIPFIFDRFYQMDKNRTLYPGSSGLGLAIVKRIIELHHSVIRVTSKPDIKTTFSFSLPIFSKESSL